MSNSHVQSAKAIAEDIAHLWCVPDDWRSQISDLARGRCRLERTIEISRLRLPKYVFDCICGFWLARANFRLLTNGDRGVGRSTGDASGRIILLELERGHKALGRVYFVAKRISRARNPLTSMKWCGTPGGT